jgi:hypothetical protein
MSTTDNSASNPTMSSPPQNATCSMSVYRRTLQVAQ